MKRPLAVLLVCGAALFAADKPATLRGAPSKKTSGKKLASKASVSRTPLSKNDAGRCFKVHRLLRADEAHYWADWTNACPFTIDAVYVLVGFADQSRKELGNGVWPMYFIQPGVHRVTRFSAPAEVVNFATVHVHRITTDSADALKDDRMAAELVEKQTVPPGTVGDTARGRVISYDPNTN